MTDLRNRVIPRNLNVSMLNIKVSPKEDNEDFTELYSRMIKDVHNQNLAFNTRGDKFLEIRTQNSYVDENQNEVIYGNLIYYTDINPDNWYNKVSRNIESYEIRSGLYANAKETEYFFIPKAHRFCVVQKSDSIALSQIEIFLSQVLPRVIPDDKEVTVTVEASEDVIDRILNASFLYSLKVGISYTNNDLSDEFEAFFDNDLREGQVQFLNLSAKSFRSEKIDIQKSKVLKSAVKLSRSNGYSKAVIKDEQGKRTTVSTLEYPRKEAIASTAGNEHKNVLTKILRIFRNE